MSLYAPYCLYCKHMDRETLLRGGPLRCTAYPDRVPGEIHEGVERHLDPYPGDHGIQFEPKEHIPPYVLEDFTEHQARKARWAAAAARAAEGE